MSNAVTHYDGCYRVHPECAIRIIDLLEVSWEQERANKNAAYAERNKCVALIAMLARNTGLLLAVTNHTLLDESGALVPQNGFDAWRSLHVDKPGEEPWDPKWRNVIYVRIPTGQLSWHIEESELPLFEGLPLRTDQTILEGMGGLHPAHATIQATVDLLMQPYQWDGHTTEEKYERIPRFVLR